MLRISVSRHRAGVLGLVRHRYLFENRHTYKSTRTDNSLSEQVRCFAAFALKGLHNRTHSSIAERRLPAFENSGVDVAREFVNGDAILDKVEWDRERNLDFLAQELVELHCELQRALDTKQNSHRVQHLGHGVYVQNNVMALDRDSSKGSPCSITREESRSCVRHALDALHSEYAVAVTGQPGIGKTRGSMMYAIQTLLHRKSAVLYVGFKSRKMLLFLPTEGGNYRVWRTKSLNFDATRFQDDARVVAVIDPPEEGPYSSMGECRILKFVSNNAEKHFRNWEKDGVLLVTSMPADKEVVAMTQVLWDDARSPHPWQIDELNTMKQKMSEVEERIELVGAIPRLVFDSDLFLRAISDFRGSAREAAESLSDTELYEAMLGKYSPFIGKHPVSTTGKLFHLLPMAIDPRSWVERMAIGREPTLRLNAVSEFELRGRLGRIIGLLRSEKFEDFAFDWVCTTEGLLPEIQCDDADGVTADAYERIASLRESNRRVYRPVAENFPFIDFATSSTTWFDAKSRRNETTIEIGVPGATKFLRELQKRIDTMGLSEYFKELVNHEVPTLIILKNRDVKVRLSQEEDLRFFGEKVRIKDRDLSAISTENCITQISGHTRTKQLLTELEKQLRRQSTWCARL